MTERSPLLVIQLNDHWRIVDHPLQWIVQYRRRYRGRSDGSEDPRSWEGTSFCRTRPALLRCIREDCGEVDPAAVAVIEALPDWHPDRDKKENPAATKGDCRVLNHSCGLVLSLSPGKTQHEIYKT